MTTLLLTWTKETKHNQINKVILRTDNNQSLSVLILNPANILCTQCVIVSKSACSKRSEKYN